MEEGQIFGSDVDLPSLPGLQSDCEKEILLLMKEVDNEFQRRNQELLAELTKVRALCRAQRDEIENLRCVLQSRNEAVQNDHLKEKVKECCSEIEKLKKENYDLRTEKAALERRIQRLSESDIQLESFKRSLSVQQDENKALRERLARLEVKYQSLQNSHKKLVNELASFSPNDRNHVRNQTNDFSSGNQRDIEIARATEKFLLEEKEFCDDFLSKMSRDIDDFEKRLQKEVS